MLRIGEILLRIEQGCRTGYHPSLKSCSWIFKIYMNKGHNDQTLCPLRMFLLSVIYFLAESSPSPTTLAWFLRLLQKQSGGCPGEVQRTPFWERSDPASTAYRPAPE
jgi:hypothetical protein